MTLTKPKGSLQELIYTWKDQIICFSPKGEGYEAYFIDPRNDNLVKYIHANCDELRHLATNYNSLLSKIKSKYEGYLKEVILNTIKYEATRRAFKKQHDWINTNYKILIEQKQLNAESQTVKIKQLKQIIAEQKQEIASIKSECRGQLETIKAENLLKQKEAEIKQKNSEISQLKQQLQECDREISYLRSELNKGLHELKLKYKWLITQFIRERAEKHKVDGNCKSLQSCQNLFNKAQRKIHLLQCENKFLRQENVDLSNKTKMLRV